ncbi:MAG: hypothetical protein IPM63_05660 [Acidobacteriota bacterium]|nr:MAG: hypothetical protein IPM63_05660 [Acidobacteriota bacterium]
MRIKIAIGFGFLLLLLLFSSDVFGCTCGMRGTPTEEFREASVVFVGTAIRATDVDGETFGKETFRYTLRTTFQVDEAFKGLRGGEVDIFTNPGAGCGISFEIGTKMVVYAYENDEDRKVLSTSVCSRSSTAEDREDEIALLRSISKGRMVSRIYGTVYELIRGIDLLGADYPNDRQPMEGVKILARSGSSTFKAVSDAEGTFRIIGVPPGTYSIIVDPPKGYKVGGDNWDESTDEEKNFYRDLRVTITNSDNPDALSIETRVDGRIAGRVFLADGRPAGEDVRVVLITRSTAHLDVGDIESVPAYTNSSGRFEFFGIPPGEYFLGFNIDFSPNKRSPFPRWYYPGLPDHSQTVPIILGRSEKLEGLNLTLPQPVREIRVRGKAVDKEGLPVNGATIEIYGLYQREWQEGDPYSQKYVRQPTFEGRVETDLNGEFELVLLEGNKYRLNPFVTEKGTYKDLMRGVKIEVIAEPGMDPLRVVLDRVPEK